MASLEPYPCCLRAVAVAAPERMAAPPPSAYRAIPQGEKSQLRIRVTHVRHGDHWQPASGECELIVDGHLLKVAAEDCVQVFGQLRQPSPAMNPGEFDFAEHSRADRQLCFVRSSSPECVTVVQQASDWSPWRWVDRLRSHWQSRLWDTVGAEHAPTAAAILLGARHAMPREMVDTYRVTGTLHVLVVSGLHAGVLISFVMALLGMGWIPRRWALVLAMVLVALYAVLTGGHPPVMRAAILAEVACLALWCGRNPFAGNSLALALIVVLLLNPADLFRTGAQLSFLCAVVLLWFSSVRWFAPLTPLQVLLRSVEPWHVRAGRRVAAYVGWTVAATLAVWIVSLPLLLERYHLVTPVAILACVPLFLCVASSLITGFGFLIVGWLIPATEPLLASLCRGSLGWLDSLVSGSSELPQAYHWTPAPDWWWTLGWYALLALLLCAGGFRWSWQRTGQVLALWVVVGTLPVLASRQQPREFQVAFLDVGHGVCSVVTTPNGTTLLYDAGSLGSPSHATETISAYLWSRGIRRIDGLVLSHPDVDHFNAVPGLVDRFKVGRVFVSPHMFAANPNRSPQSAPQQLEQLLLAHDIPIQVIEMGQRLTLDRSSHAEVLFPDKFGGLASDNSNSVVLSVECDGHRVLLPGDLESPGIEQVMASDTLPCDVLLAPHHGSRRSDPPGFAAWSQPRCVVVSGGRGEVDRNVADSYRQAGADVLHTGQTGAIEFTFTDQGCQISPFLSPL
ncbi:ComEC family competence protein [Aeoliella mucimassa]|uniref:ComEC family competence protein n=2 Tax=Aeoliella mucimassa TaxID=2527972 RepID=A0A518AKE6_9BACT|nr:ComEC family competence protein [Aeoliella mucimassa]